MKVIKLPKKETKMKFIKSLIESLVLKIMLCRSDEIFKAVDSMLDGKHEVTDEELDAAMAELMKE